MFGLRVVAGIFLLAGMGALGADYVGSAACKTCHPDVWNNFYKNPHYKSIAAGKPDGPDTGCESCHGPGKAHVDAKGGKATIVAFSELSPAKTLDACLRCHSESLSRANIRRSSHTREDIVCSNCHSIHKSPTQKFLLAKKQTDLCYGCHASVRAQFAMPFKHRVNEGMVQCTDCHNPHGAFAATWRSGSRPRMIEQVQANEEPCLKCHVDKRGPFLYEHPAVRVDGCETCHMPHGSTNPRLMRRPTVFTMCLECHNGLGTFGRRNAGIPMVSGTHNLADPRYQNCVTCHPKIHGSNSHQFFMK
jgi:DmsE family decaheme c-type cytochrome